MVNWFQHTWTVKRQLQQELLKSYVFNFLAFVSAIHVHSANLGLRIVSLAVLDEYVAATLACQMSTARWPWVIVALEFNTPIYYCKQAHMLGQAQMKRC